MRKLINKIIVLIGILLVVACVEQKQEPVNTHEEKENQTIIINQQGENDLTHL